MPNTDKIVKSDQSSITLVDLFTILLIGLVGLSLLSLAHQGDQLEKRVTQLELRSPK